jgi:glycosyltransferase involved in cell wall biosynthesis
MAAHWPNARLVAPASLRDEDIDVVVLQRTEEIDAVERLTGRRPGRDIPALYLEHNAPRPRPESSLHPLGGQRELPIVHVTHFNELFWDCDGARTLVVEHGVPDPDVSYSGELERLGVVMNEPGRRRRVTGADLLPEFAELAPVDVFGIRAADASDAAGFGIHDGGDLAPDALHAQLARHRVYVHPYRWTSLGLSLLEAMMIGMPIVAVAATEMIRALPPGAGIISTELAELTRGARAYLADPALAASAGARAREHATEHYSLERFLARWDETLADVVDAFASRARGARLSSPVKGVR